MRKNWPLYAAVYLLIGFAILEIYLGYQDLGDPAAGLALRQLMYGTLIGFGCSQLKR